MEIETIKTFPGKYGAVHIDIKADRELTGEEKEFIMKTTRENTKGAIWVWVPREQLKFHVKFLEDNFHQHSFRRIQNGLEYYVYYMWTNRNVEDKVPKFATSVGGAGILIISSDGKRVLLVHEYGKYKTVTGAVEINKLAHETAIKEAQEEVGIEINREKPLKCCGIWNKAHHAWNVKLGEEERNTRVNDVMICFSGYAKTEKITVDGFEIEKAKWFEIDDLIKIRNEMKQNKKGLYDPNTKVGMGNTVEYDGNTFSSITLEWLNNFVEGKCWDIQEIEDTTLIY